MRRIGRYRYIPSVHIVLDCVVLPRSIHIEVMLTLSSVFTLSSNGADMGNGSAREPPVLSIPLKPQNCPRKRPFSNATRPDSDQCENFFWGVAHFLSWHSHLLKAVAYMTIDERRGSVETRRPGRQHFHGHRRPVVPLLLCLLLLLHGRARMRSISVSFVTFAVSSELGEKALRAEAHAGPRERQGRNAWVCVEVLLFLVQRT